MKPFLKIEEVAELLNLDYKTVYRLVLSGQLPAAKIGAVYRIGQEDLDRFLEAQKVSPRNGEDTAAMAQVASCARCGLAFRVPSLVAGKCQEPGCDAPLCTSCWEKPPDRFCSDHSRPERTMSLEKAEELHRKGELPTFVKAEVARQLELTFVSRFDQQVREQSRVVSPRDESWIEVKDWASLRREAPSLLPTAEGALVVKHGRGRRHLPRNLTSFYYVGSSTSNRESFVIGVGTLSHVATYSDQGFDTAPATLAELQQIIDNALDLVHRQHALLVLGLASTTGWERAAEDAIVGSATSRGFSHDDLAVCLVDLFADRLAYNPGDSRIRSCLQLFGGKTSREKEQLARDFVQREIIQGERLGITDRDVCEAGGVGKEVAERIFYDLASQGKGRVERGPHGLLFLKDIERSK